LDHQQLAGLESSLPRIPRGTVNARCRSRRRGVLRHGQAGARATDRARTLGGLTVGLNCGAIQPIRHSHTPARNYRIALASELLLATISDFETMLTQNGTKILKFFLHINPEEQHDKDAGRTVVAVLANACPAR
jgi:hypothetical protein